MATVGIGYAAPFAPQIAGGAVSSAGGAVERASSPFAGKLVGATGAPGVGQAVADRLGDVGATLAGTTGLGLVGVFAGKSVGIRGKSEAEQRAKFGQASLATVQTGVSVGIPFVGPLVAALVGVAARTKAGAQAVAVAGKGAGHVYEAQKNFFNKGQLDFGDGGKARRSSFFWLVDQRVTELKQGGKLEAKDVEGFKQALGMGYVFSGGFDLSKLNLAVGDNPFVRR